MARLTDAPTHLDGALVLAVADARRARPTGMTVHRVGAPGHEKVLSGFSALAIAQCEEGGGEFYVFYCDPEWRVMTDTSHRTFEEAVEQAESEFEGLRFLDVNE